MAVERNGERLGTFPDLLMTFDKQTGEPVTTADLCAGQELVLVRVPYGKLILGSGMSELAGYLAIENVLGIKVVPYVQTLIY